MQRGKKERRVAGGKRIEADLGLCGSEQEAAQIAKMQAVQVRFMLSLDLIYGTHTMTTESSVRRTSVY